MTTTFESVAAELDAASARCSVSHDEAFLAKNSGAIPWWAGRRDAYAAAASLVRARALPAMDREGLIECIGEHYDRHGDMAAPNLADAILARFAPPAPVVTPQPAQANEPARVEVGDEAIERAHRAYSDALQNGAPGDGTRVQKAWRAAFAAADVVPRAELEAMRAERDGWQQAHAKLEREWLKTGDDLAAATQRAEAAEREAREWEQRGNVWRQREESEHAARVTAERERDEARATLARLGTREAAERVVRAYYENEPPEYHAGFVPSMHAALTAVLGAPAAEPAPAPVTREQFESLARRVTALDESVMQLMRESGAKGGAQ